METIQFPYRGWVVRVTPESNGWLAHLKLPDGQVNPLNPRFSEDGFLALPVGLLDSACDAVTAAMRWADTKTIGRSLHEALSELVASDRLHRDELRCLTSSARDELVKMSPRGECHDY